MPNSLKQLQELGQEVWLDYIRRSLTRSGGLRRMIDHDALTGMTSNPTLFEKAISQREEYDEQIRELMGRHLDAGSVYTELVIKDIQEAADVFRPVFDGTKGQKGFVSLEVNPHLAYDTQGTVEQVREFSQKVNRPNVMFKIPATREGLAAIERSIAEGININVTLIFSMGRYEQVANAYIAGLEQLVKKGKPLHTVSSVASVFVSRIDSKVDEQLDQKGNRDLKGKAAIANTKLIYQKFKEIFFGPRFSALQAQGAKAQRPLWGSTGSKNPAYSDVMYVEELIGPQTVNTMPPKTLEAFREHGRAALTIEKNLDEAHQVLKELTHLRIDLSRIMAQLEEEGVESFAKAYDQLIHSLEGKLHQVH